MYHVIGERKEAPARFVVPLGAFERQMAWLARLRFNVLRLEDAVRRQLSGEPLPARAVVLTFDDGTRDMLTNVLPVLKRHGFPATAFVVTQAMGGQIHWTERPGIARRQILTWDEALELEPLVSLQPHTRTHPSLPTLDDDQLRDEIAGSRADLQQRTGRLHEFFAYPYGHYDERVADAAKGAGYTAALSVKWGWTDTETPRFELRRYEIRGDDSLTRFLKVVSLSGIRTRLRRAARRS
jgi:peptidoglycan/xylan/chitin deacetylase (PgdA/CDA1 family)